MGGEEGDMPDLSDSEDDRGSPRTDVVLSKSQVAGVAGKEGDKYARDNRVMCMGERWVKLMRREGSSARWRRGTSSWGRSSSRVAEISSNSTRHALY